MFTAIKGEIIAFFIPVFKLVLKDVFKSYSLAAPSCEISNQFLIELIHLKGFLKTSPEGSVQC